MPQTTELIVLPGKRLLGYMRPVARVVFFRIEIDAERPPRTKPASTDRLRGPETPPFGSAG